MLGDRSASSRSLPPRLVPPSVHSNDCPLHAPYHHNLQIFPHVLWPPMDTKTQCTRWVRGLYEAVTKSNTTSRYGIVHTKYKEVEALYKNTLSLPTNQLSAHSLSYCRGQRSDKEGQLAPDQASLSAFYSKLYQKPSTAASYCRTSPLH